MISETSSISLTRKIIKQTAGGTIYNRGLDYFKSGKVIEYREIADNAAEGTVQGWGANKYSARIDFSNGRFFSSCTCPYIWSDVCKHAVALALHHMHYTDQKNQKNRSPRLPDDLQADFETQISSQQFAQKLYLQNSLDPQRVAKATAHLNREIEVTGEDKTERCDIEDIAWQQILEQMVAPRKTVDNTGVQKIIYRLELGENNRLVLETNKARIGKRGIGKENRFYYDRTAFNSSLSHTDNAIFGLLLRNSPVCYSHSHRIGNDVLDPLLKLLYDEEYVFLGDSDTKVDISLDPVGTTLVLREDGENHVLEVSFSTSISEYSVSSYPPYSPVIIGENRPWITDGRTFRPLETKAPGSVIAKLLKQPQIISRAHLDLFMNLYYDPLARKESIDIKSTVFDSIRDDIPARAVINLEADGDTLLIKPCFAYGDGPPQVEPGNKSRIIAASINDESVWVKRRFDLEQDVYRRLEAGGVDFGEQQDGRNLNDYDSEYNGDQDDHAGQLKGEAALDFLFNEVPRLQVRGCEFVGETSSLRVNRTVPKISATTSSGIDWFDLGFAFDYGKETVDLPTVLAAYQSGKRYVKLGDGDWGALPIEWLNKSNTVFDELSEYGKASDKNNSNAGNSVVRLRSYHIPLIEDMISEIDLQPDLNLAVHSTDSLPGFNSEMRTEMRLDLHSAVDPVAKLNRLRKRLATFSGLEQVELPERLNAVLRDYQRKGLDWLGFLSDYSFGGILADDMGLGKTVQTLAHLLRRKQANRDENNARPVHPSLIIAPTSVAYNWKDEAERFTPDLNTFVLTGPDRHEDFSKIPEADIVITTYALLRRDFETLIKYAYDYVVLDEAQYIKNPAAQTSRLCKSLTSSHRLALTGTPIENNLSELWSIFDFLMPGFLSSHKNFRDRYEKPIVKAAKDKEKTEDGAEALERLRKKVKPFILRRLKQQVASELPPKTEVINYCEMTSAQENLYRQVLNTYRAKVFEAIDLNGVERSHITILDALLKLRQVCNHPQLLKLSSNNINSSGKMDALKEMIEQLLSENHNALIFSQFTQMLGLVRKWLDEREIPYCYLDGSSRNRREIIERFNSGKTQLFLISLKAGGTGLNLTAADYVIHIDPWWNPAVENQATDRAHRIGQDKHVFVYKLITKNSIEEKILKLQNNKKALVDTMLSSGVVGKSLTKEDLDELFSV